MQADTLTTFRYLEGLHVTYSSPLSKDLNMRMLCALSVTKFPFCFFLPSTSGVFLRRFLSFLVLPARQMSEETTKAKEREQVRAREIEIAEGERESKTKRETHIEREKARGRERARATASENL